MSNNKDFKVKNGIQAATYHEAMGTVVSVSVGYSLINASYDSVRFNLASQDTGPVAFAMKDDGTALYMHGATNDSLYQYTLSTAWDLSTISYASKSFLTSTQNGNAGPVAFKSDGTSFYVSGSTNDTVYQYDMGTAWDISTASYASKSFSVSGQETTPTGLFFKSDGTKMYMLGSGTDAIYQYTLSTAWDVSTASYDSVTFSLSAQGTSPTSLYFKSDGTQFYTTDANGVFKYNLSTAWDISTASYAETYNTTSEGTNPYQSWFKSDGTKMFVVSLTNDRIHQYSTVQNTAELDLSTGNVFEITPTDLTEVSLINPPSGSTVASATLLTNYSKSNLKLSSQEKVATLDTSVDVTDTERDSIFKPDGTKLYVAGSGGGLYQYGLSTAWDLSTATYDSVTFTLTEGTQIYGIAFKSDGTKLYALDRGSDTVHQYSLSTAWDLSTITYDSVSFATAGESLPGCMRLNSDGTKLYVGGSSGNGIDTYTLSTAWDLSTAGSGSFTSFGFDVDGLALSSDGTYLAVMSDGLTTPNVDYIELYFLTTAWDVSTADDLNDRSFAPEEEGTANNIFFGSDDSYLYLTTTNSTIQYASAESYPIIYDSNVTFKTPPLTVRPGETDVITLTTRDSGTSYQGALVMDGVR